MDETPIFFTMQLNGIIAAKKYLQVAVSTTDQEKQRVTLVLSVAGNGAKLKPFFIFCWNVESDILYKRIEEILNLKTKKHILALIKTVGWPVMLWIYILKLFI